MIDDTGLREFDGSSRGRRSIYTLAAISLAAAACADAAPPDDALASELSSGEVLALCDELRDAAQRDDRPIQCDSMDYYWVLPSNAACMNADLSACTLTAGQLRRCHELARQFPCSQPNAPVSPAAFSPPEPDPIFADCLGLDVCSPFVATTGYTYVSPECPRVGLASLQAFDGVYEVEGFPFSWPDPSCPPLPEPFESTRYFALVSTEVSGAAEVILQNCDTVADCQALARTIQAPGSAPVVEAVAAYNHLLACDAPDAIALQSIVPDVPWCQLMSEPAIGVLSDPSLLRVLLSGRTDTEVSPGCGYIIPPDAAESGSCPSIVQIRAMPVAPL